MKKLLLLTLISLWTLTGLFAQDYIVTVANFSFTDADLVINAGETVMWQNTTGTHNVNGSQATFPGNPESFINGAPAAGSWTFSFTFNTPGVYEYHCDNHPTTMMGTITVMGGPLTNDLILTGVYDGPLTGGQPKGIELYVVNDIPDLSVFGVGSANNGQGSDGQEYTFPNISATAGDYLFLTPDPASFESFFGFAPDFEDVDGATNINGDDAVELFENGTVIDVFGEIDADGTGTAWEHLDGWAYRVDGTGPDGSTFVLANWFFSGIDGLEGGSTNGTVAVPFPIETYDLVPSQDVNANDDSYTVAQNGSLDFNTLTNDFLPNGTGIVITQSQPSNGDLFDFGEGVYTYVPFPDYCGPDSFTYQVCDNSIPSCDEATVNITVQCPVNYPSYDIGAVTTVDANSVPDSVGVDCSLTGIVYGVDLQVNDDIQFVIIDATGGISLYSPTSLGYTVQEGDEVTVQGKIEAFNCLTQISPISITVNSTDNPLITPPVVTEMTEAEESELVRINNVTPLDPSQWDNSGSGMNIDVEDGDGNQFLVRIDDAVDLYSMPIPNFPWDVIGLGGQFDNDGVCNDGYQLLPRYMSDIISLVATNDTDLSEFIRVFPNPVNEQVFWQTPLELENVTLYDTFGRALKLENGNSRSMEISDLPAGMYFLRFLTTEGQYSETLVVE